MKSRLTLCITKTALLPIKNHPETKVSIQDTDGKKVMYAIDLNKVNEDAFHFIDRSVVDSKDNEDFKRIGALLPHLIPYIAIKCGDEYLTYARKGTETRLHGSRSLGLGGHIDLADYQQDAPIMDTLRTATKRELVEEVGYTGEFEFQDAMLIDDESNEVGTVHLGFFAVVEIADKAELNFDDEELEDPQWATLEQLASQDQIELYENWSQMAIRYMMFG